MASQPAAEPRLQPSHSEIDVVVEDVLGTTLKKRAADEIERPDSFMYVSG